MNKETSHREGTRCPGTYLAFPGWLADQVCRRDEIGHMARLAVATGAIDRSNSDLVNQAIIEWAQDGRSATVSEVMAQASGTATD